MVVVMVVVVVVREGPSGSAIREQEGVNSSE